MRSDRQFQSHPSRIALLAWLIKFSNVKPKWILLAAVLAGLIWANPCAARAAAKEVMVYYMPWYSAKPHSEHWGWHWTMDHFNPDHINAAGEREIASWYYP